MINNEDIELDNIKKSIIEERLSELRTYNYRIEGIHKEIFSDFKKLQKKLPISFFTRFRWISKLGHFNDYKDFHKHKFKISFQILEYEVSLIFDNYDYIINFQLIKDKDKIWVSGKNFYFSNFEYFEESIEKSVRKAIPEYDKILLRIEKFNRVIESGESKHD